MHIRRLAMALLLATLAFQLLAEDRFAAELASVEEIRGRKFASEVKHETLPRQKLREFLVAQIDRDLPMGSAGYLDLLKAMYLVDPDVTIDPLLDLYDAQVLAFYDPATHVYYAIDEPPKDVPMSGAMLEAVEIHELMHALQDQSFDAGRKTIELQSDWDAALAYQALLEGEATLVMLAELSRKSGIDVETMVGQEGMVEALRDAAARSEGVPAGIPDYFVESLQFPYVEGLAFGLDAFKSGGWKALDAIHANPPISTEEILRPDRYRQRIAEGKGHTDPGTTEADGELVTVLGEFHWRFLLGKQAGEGWSLDRVVVRRCQRGVTVLADTSWDSPTDAREYAEAIGAMLERRKAKNVRTSTIGTRVLAAWGSDAKAIGAFVKKKK